MKTEILKNGFFGLTITNVKDNENNIWKRKEFFINTVEDFDFRLVVAFNKDTNEVDYRVTNFNMDYSIKDINEDDLLEDIYTNRLKELFA